MNTKFKISPIGRHGARIKFEDGQFSGREFELSGERLASGKLWVGNIIELVPIEKAARKEIVNGIPKIRLKLDDFGIDFMHLSAYIRNDGHGDSDIIVKTGKLHGRRFRMPMNFFSHGQHSELYISAFDGVGEYYEVFNLDEITKESLKEFLSKVNDGNTFEF